MTSRTVVAAIAVGCHGTGLAWARADDPDSTVHVHDRWPATTGRRTRTALLTGPGGETVAWGDAAVAHPGAADPARLHQCLTAALGSGTDPVAMRRLAAFLAEVHAHAVLAIADRERTGPDDVTWRLTVPDTWSPREQTLLRRAAEQAGFPDTATSLVGAGEAAAAEVAARAGIPDRFAVVDVGWSTVDAVAVQVDAPPAGGVPLLARLDLPLAAPSGADGVDRAFLGEVVRSRFEDATYRLFDDPTATTDLMGAWERAKSAGPTGGALRVGLPASVAGDPRASALLAATQDGHRDVLVVSPGEIDLIWGPVADRVLALVRAMVATTQVQRLFLVGGPAPALWQRCSRALAGTVELAPPTATPADAELCGAVRGGLGGAHPQRWSHTYGVALDAPFDVQFDDPARRTVDGYGVERCRGRFAVLAERGRPVTEAGTLTVYPPDPRAARVGVRILAASTTEQRYADGADVRLLGMLEVDVSSTAGRPQQARGIGVGLRTEDAGVVVTARDLHTGVELARRFDAAPAR